MRDASDVPELGEDFAARAVHRVGDSFPPRDLRGRVHAGRADVAHPLRAHLRGLGDDQPGGGALGVIGGRERIWHVTVDGAAARHRRHHQAVGEIEIAQAIGREQRAGRGRRLRENGIFQGNGFVKVHDFAPDGDGAENR
jgi:hypothetical protein